MDYWSSIPVRDVIFLFSSMSKRTLGLIQPLVQSIERLNQTRGEADAG